MQFKLIATAAALACSFGAASAESWNLGPYTVDYDESTDFSYLSGAFSSSGGQHGFNWTVPSTAQVASFGDLEIVTIPIPSFTIWANAGWTLSDPGAFLGNLVFTEVGGATRQVKIYADVSVDGGSPIPLMDDVNWTKTASGPGFLNGYFGETYGPVSGGFTSLSVTNASIVLSATGGIFSSISSQPQNKLEVTLVAMPVPEPETYAMMLAGLGALGWMARRRRMQG